MAWHDDYTNTEIESLLTNMCNWIGEHLDENYNWGDLEREELIKIYVDMGLHEDEVRSWYDWLDD
jgi:hypothetical protein